MVECVIRSAGGLPLVTYDEYADDFNRLSAEQKIRVGTFLRMASLDPDDYGLLAVCKVLQKRLRDPIYLYPLDVDPKGPFIFWRVVRQKQRFLSLSPRKPLRVNLLGIEHLDDVSAVTEAA